MTVAAILIAESEDAALTPAEGLPLARRLVDVSWSGGALPVVVVARDPAGRVAQVLEGTAALLVSPAAGAVGEIDAFASGLEAALGSLAATTAGLLWPARLGWVDPGTVTALIEAHGARPASILRAGYQGEPGFPALLPALLLPHLHALRRSSADAALTRLADEGVPLEPIELGDPGVLHDVGAPRSSLPPYEGPVARPAVRGAGRRP